MPKLPSDLRKEIVRVLNASANVLAQQDLVFKTKTGTVRIALDPSAVISTMAYNREMYIDRVKEKLRGGCREHFKAVFAERELRLRQQAARQPLGIPKDLLAQRWVDHWSTEARRLLQEELPDILLHSVKFKPSSRAKAARQAFEQFMEEEAHGKVDEALAIVASDYGLPSTKVKVKAEDLKDFRSLVEQVISKTFV